MTIRHAPLHWQGQRILPPKENKENYNSRKPKISFEFLGGDYCISMCEMREKAEVIDTLYRLSQHTWQELLTMGRKHGGCEPLPLSELKCRIPDDSLFLEQRHATVFHNPKRIPIVGFRIEDVLFVFCIDRTFSAYRHGA